VSAALTSFELTSGSACDSRERTSPVLNGSLADLTISTTRSVRPAAWRRGRRPARLPVAFRDAPFLVPRFAVALRPARLAVAFLVDRFPAAFFDDRLAVLALRVVRLPVRRPRAGPAPAPSMAASRSAIS
jgi:hypothetical protein